MFNISRSQQVCHRQIIRFGRTPENPNSVGQLRRSGILRDCTTAILEYKPHEKGLVLEGAQRSLISVIGLTLPPNHELDILLYNGRAYRLVQADMGPRPGGTPIFHDYQVIYDASEHVS